MPGAVEVRLDSPDPPTLDREHLSVVHVHGDPAVSAVAREVGPDKRPISVRTDLYRFEAQIGKRVEPSLGMGPYRADPGMTRVVRVLAGVDQLAVIVPPLVEMRATLLEVERLIARADQILVLGCDITYSASRLRGIGRGRGGAATTRNPGLVQSPYARRIMSTSARDIASLGTPFGRVRCPMSCVAYTRATEQSSGRCPTPGIRRPLRGRFRPRAGRTRRPPAGRRSRARSGRRRPRRTTPARGRSCRRAPR